MTGTRKSYLTFISAILTAVLLVSCGGGGGGGGSATVGPTNAAPVIKSILANPNSVQVGGSIALLCNATDTNNDQLSYSWTVTGGSLNTFIGSNVTWTVSSTTGNYSATCSVSDGKAVVSANVSVTVISPSGSNQNPVISSMTASPSSIPVGGRTTITVIASDPDGDVIGYSYSANGGSVTGISSIVNYTAPATAGTYTVQVVVTDGKGGAVSRQVQVAVTAGGAPNTPPVADAGPNQNVTTGSAVTLDGSGSTDADGNVLTYRWTLASKPSGSAASLSSTTAMKPTFTADKDGTYVISLVVNDYFADSAADTVTLTATAEQTIYPYDFEAGIGSWSADNGVWEVGAPTSGPMNAHSGNNVAATVLAGYYPSNDIESHLISPAIILPTVIAGGEISLRFWHWFSFYCGFSCGTTDGDHGRVEISYEISPGTWSNWITISNIYSSQSASWSYPRVELYNYSGKKVRIGFLFHNAGSSTAPGWYIDDILIQVPVGDVAPPDTTAPSVPTNLIATAVSPYQINLSWTPSTDNVGVTGYKIYKDGSYLKSITNTTASDTTGLSALTQYCYRVLAYDGAGNESSQSTQACATTPTTPPNLFFDDFEAGIGSWWADNGVWEVGAPTSGPNAAYSGTKVAATVLAGNYPYTDSRLVSPSIQLSTISAGQEIHLRFWHWFKFNTWGPDYGKVQVSYEISAGSWSTWTTVSTPNYSGSSSAWSSPLVDLSGYAGKKVRIGFLLDTYNPFSYGEAQAGWYIDDVLVEIK